jgi:hypothetical protein
MIVLPLNINDCKMNRIFFLILLALGGGGRDIYWRMTVRVEIAAIRCRAEH